VEPSIALQSVRKRVAQGDAGRAIRAALFDVDGTLLDSNALHIEAWRRAFAQFDIGVSRRALQAQMGNGGDRLVRALCAPQQAERIGPRLIQRHVEIFTRDYLDQVRPFPGVRSLFERLRSDGVQVALASSARQSERNRHIEILGVADLLDGATNGQAIEKAKPNPDVFQCALATLYGVRTEEAIVVGDSPWDALAAARAGMQTIGVLSGGFSKPRLWEAGARFVYLDVAELLASIDGSPFGRRERSVPAATCRS